MLDEERSHRAIGREKEESALGDENCWRERDGDSWKEKLALSDEDKLCHVVGASERRRADRRGEDHVSATEGDSWRIIGSSKGDGDIRKGDEALGEEDEERSRSDKDERIGEGWAIRADGDGGGGGGGGGGTRKDGKGGERRGDGEGRARECARAVGWWWKSEGA